MWYGSNVTGGKVGSASTSTWLEQMKDGGRVQDWCCCLGYQKNVLKGKCGDSALI